MSPLYFNADSLHGLKDKRESRDQWLAKLDELIKAHSSRL